MLVVTLPERPRAEARTNVINNRYVIRSPPVMPMALAELVCCDPLFTREAYRQVFEKLRNASGDRIGCRIQVELLRIAHERGLDAEIAAALSCTLQAHELLNIAEYLKRHCADEQALPQIVVTLPELSVFDEQPDAEVAP